MTLQPHKGWERFACRSTDVLLAAPPKSGTTWMSNILYQLKSGGDPSFTSIYDVVPLLQPNVSDTLSDPRIFKTHLAASRVPPRKEFKLILLLRDPRECCISFYHHINNALADAGRPARFSSMQDCVAYWIQRTGWYDVVRGWWEEAPFRILYSDLKVNLSACLERLSQFLEWPLSPEMREAALRFSSFAWMREHTEKFTQRPGLMPRNFMRQGEAGRFHEELTPAQADAILKRAQQTLPPDCLAYLGI